jgi:hypothetical protein
VTVGYPLPCGGWPPESPDAENKRASITTKDRTKDLFDDESTVITSPLPSSVSWHFPFRAFIPSISRGTAEILTDPLSKDFSGLSGA